MRPVWCFLIGGGTSGADNMTTIGPEARGCEVGSPRLAGVVPLALGVIGAVGA